MRCLITGGAGFIGSHIADEAVRRGWEVTLLDDFSSGKRENIEHLKKSVRVVVADVADRDCLRETARDIDIIFHLAALVSVPESVRDPWSSANINDLGSLNVFHTAAALGVRRVVFSSSAAVYGPVSLPPHCETLPPDPITPYAAHKLLGEHYARFFHATHGLEAVCLRYFNVYGPRQDPASPYSGVISIFTDRLRRNQPITIYGDGGQTRDFVYVGDVVRANFLAAECATADGRAMNVGTTRAVTVNGLLQTLCDITGHRVPVTYAPPRSGDIRASWASVDRARELLGFEARVPFDEGLRQTVGTC